ncbi:MAG: glycosyltransferase family 4 protein, partial [Deltaproteobacteria bacterium]
TGNIEFIGSVGYQRYLELLQKSDVFVHPSNVAENGDMEGLPTAICEAMACGLPVLSTRHSGIPEIIDDGENGLLVDERDSDGLYQNMVLLRKIDIANMSRNARAKIEARFNHRKTMPIFANYLLSIIERRGLEL